jgi:prepilin peptidase dependent protein A/type IV fimbrial biogenesis protein FimT
MKNLIGNGFGILESLLVLSIISLLAVMGTPHILASLHHQQLKGALQQSYFLMQTARAEAISQNKAITVQVIAGENWCLAANDSGPCDCTIANACSINQLEHSVTAAQFPNIKLTKTVMGKDSAVVFDGTRGIAVGHAGSGFFSNDESEAKLIVSNLGRVRICMLRGSMGAYQTC